MQQPTPLPALTTTRNIRALQWLFDLSTDYKRHGEKLGVALSDGGAFASQNVTISGVSEATISGSVTLPAGYTLASKRMAAGFADRSLIDVLTDTGVSTNFAYTTPSLTGATIQMQVTAQNAAGTSVVTTKPGLAVNATSVSVPVPAGSDLMPNAATGSTTAPSSRILLSPAVCTSRYLMVRVQIPIAWRSLLRPARPFAVLARLGLGCPRPQSIPGASRGLHHSQR